MLPTTTICFSLDHKWNVSSRILFSLDHKLYVSDYDSDSDSVTSENQPLLLPEFQTSVGVVYSLRDI